MSTRLEGSDDNAFITDLERMRTDLDALKSAQKVGARNIITYVNSTAATYDKAVTLVYPSSTLASFSIFFTAARQAYCDAELSFRVYFDSMSTEIHPNSANWPYIGVAIPHTLLTSGGLLYQYDVNMYMSISGTHTYYIKCQVTATDQGVITTT